MPKRNATSELNHDNWNDEETPEEAGTFEKASQDVIEKRVIRNARRRGPGNSGSGTSGVFSSFQGFSKPENPSAFSFLKKSNAVQDGAGQTKPEGDDSKVEISSPIPMFKGPTKEVLSSQHDLFLPTPPYTPSYLGQVKRLNECFIKHIQTCFDESKFIILSPCFRDYNKHLMNILPLNNSSDKGEADIQTSELKSETPFSQKQGLGDESSSNVVSEKKNHLPGITNTETSVKPGFKMFGVGSGGEVNKLPSTNPVTIGTTLPFGAAAKKQFPWTSGWVASSSPKQISASEQTSEEAKEGTTAPSKEDPTEESDVPPKVEFKQVVEEGAVYSRRCKVFVKKEKSYHDHGVGMLYLKPVETGQKTQLIVRADTSLGNLLINTLLSADMSMQKMGNNNVMLICIPTPDAKPSIPLPVLLRVKTSEDADELLQKLNEFKK